MPTTRCRAKEPFACRTHGLALAQAYFAPRTAVRSAGLAGGAYERYAVASAALEEALPRELMWALESYMATSHSFVNAWLRSGRAGVLANLIHENYRNVEPTPRLRARWAESVPKIAQHARELVAQIDQAFALGQQVQAAPSVLYRSVRVWSPTGAEVTSAGERKAWLAEHYPVGKVVTAKTYTSTSADSDFMLAQARRRPSQLVVQEILTSKGLPLDRSADTGNIQALEREVLLPRNMKFEVVNTTTAKFEASGHAPEGPTWVAGRTPAEKRYTVVQLREVA